MNDAQPMMPVADHDEYAEQMFIRDFKMYVAEEWDPLQRQLVTQVAKQLAGADAQTADAKNGGATAGNANIGDAIKIGDAKNSDPNSSDPKNGDPPATHAAAVDAGDTSVATIDTEKFDLAAVRERLMEHESYRWWLNFRRAGQELLWDGVGRCVDRQLNTLNARARIERPRGSLTLDEKFEPPNYIKALDIHLMPGGYAVDDGLGSVRQGALMDRGGAVFLLGRNGGLMNDGRGHTLVAHLFEKYPDLAPRRILDMGCGVGPSTVAVGGYFKEAEHHAIDVGSSMLRYAHARAEHLGAAIHFSQQSAGDTRFADGSFDLVYSCILLHETSARMLPRIMREAYRVLRPGGVMIHLEVPMRYEDGGLWGGLQTDFEATYNNEPFWRGATSADYAALMREVGLVDITVGYQTAARPALRGNRGFTTESKGVFGSWFVASARK